MRFDDRNEAKMRGTGIGELRRLFNERLRIRIKINRIRIKITRIRIKINRIRIRINRILIKINRIRNLDRKVLIFSIDTKYLKKL